LKSSSIASKDIQTKSRLRENIEAIGVAIILALFIRTFIVQAFKIPSGSMKETLQIGDHILVNKFIYGVKLPFLQSTLIPIKNPQRGDIVVFEFPVEKDKDFIKRVVGVTGDVVEVRNKQVWVNGALQQGTFIVNSDPHVFPGNLQPRDNFGPTTVPEHSLFVMGDNRDHSYDSRYWGFVDLKAVKGKAFIIYWSWDKDKLGNGWAMLENILECVRWGRLGNLLK
jgi:signal peptidase I